MLLRDVLSSPFSTLMELLHMQLERQQSVQFYLQLSNIVGTFQDAFTQWWYQARSVWWSVNKLWDYQAGRYGTRVSLNKHLKLGTKGLMSSFHDSPPALTYIPAQRRLRCLKSRVWDDWSWFSTIVSQKYTWELLTKPTWKSLDLSHHLCTQWEVAKGVVNNPLCACICF